MFAVKGWAVNSSALKPQTEPFKTGPLPQKPQKDQSTSAANGEQKTSKKRKRGDAPGPSGGEVDVGKLWDKHIVGGAPDPPKKVKKPKVEQDETNRPKTKKEKKAAKAAKKAAKRPVSANDTPLGERKERKEKVEGQDGEVREDATQVASQEPVHIETGAERLNVERAGPKLDGITTSKKDKKRRKSEEIKADDGPPPASAAKTAVKAAPPQPAAPAAPPAPTLTPMQAAMRQKLISARFRHLNQTLYTEPSLKALQLFSRDPQMFEDYHSGFRQQVAVWPSNPVDTFIETIRSRGAIRLPHQKKPFKGKFAKAKKPAPEAEDSTDLKALALPRTQGVAIIADLGCGDARIAQTFRDSGEGHSLNLKILSYDLHSPSPLVTRADISKIPTEDGSVDVAIFCLALMGTNWISFIEEAYRILHWKGELWIAEIKSRFGRVGGGGGKGSVVAHSVGGKRKLAAIKKAEAAKAREGEEVNEQDALAVEVDGVESAKTEETDVSAFVDVLRRRGFLLKNEAIVKNGESSIDLSNKMFVKMEFVKAAAPTKGKGVPTDEEGRPPVKEERFKKGKKFVEEEVIEVPTDDEAKVLKPCLYKIR